MVTRVFHSHVGGNSIFDGTFTLFVLLSREVLVEYSVDGGGGGGGVAVVWWCVGQKFL